MIIMALSSLLTIILITTVLSSGSSVDTGGGFSIDCPCIDVSSVFIPASNCIVENTDDESGLFVYTSSIDDKSSCIPVTYGSSSCMQHDMSRHPLCLVDNYNISNQDAVLLPEFCRESWCYVDSTLCRDSSESFMRTDLFRDLREANRLYYSYSTCNSTDYYTDHDFATTLSTKGKFISVVVPDMLSPSHYKEGFDNDEVDGDGDALSLVLYENDTVPWKGWFIEYLNDVLDISDIGGFNYTHRSKYSSIAKNSSFWTASVYDVQHGISCLGAGNFWMTEERLAMTSFTASLTIDKVMLWIKNPYDTNRNKSGSTYEQILNIGKPFERSLWLTLIASFLLVSVMNIWFVSKKKGQNVLRDKLHYEAYKNGTIFVKIITVLNVILDSCLDTAQMVFGGSVESDADTFTSRKILYSGFGFLILISVTGYTANLAAFLTTLSTKQSFIQSIEEAIFEKVPLCAHVALKSNLLLAYPDAIWVFHEDNKATNEDGIYNDMVESFDNGRCTGIVSGIEEVFMDPNLMTSFCDQKLVYIESVVLEVPIAMPVCKEFDASISYWIYKAKERGIEYESYREKSSPPEVCELSLQQIQRDDNNGDSLRQLTVIHFTVPFVVLALCCVISTVLQFRHQARLHRRPTLFPTMFRSRDLDENNDDDDDDDDDDNDNDDNNDNDDDDDDYEERKDEEKEKVEVYNDHQHQSLFQQPIVLPPIEDIKSKDPATMLRALGEVRNYQDTLRNYQDTFQIYERNLVELMMEEQRNKEHME